MYWFECFCNLRTSWIRWNICWYSMWNWDVSALIFSNLGFNLSSSIKKMLQGRLTAFSKAYFPYSRPSVIFLLAYHALLLLPPFLNTFSEQFLSTAEKGLRHIHYFSMPSVQPFPCHLLPEQTCFLYNSHVIYFTLIVVFIVTGCRRQISFQT